MSNPHDRDKQGQMPNRDPLNGKTLEMMLNELVVHYGWAELGKRVRINCFTSEPSVASSLKFLRRTPWARAKVEELYRDFLWEKEGRDQS